MKLPRLFEIEFKKRTTAILIVIAALFAPSSRGAVLLSTLRKEHPRLLVLAEGFKQARQVAGRDPRAAVYYKQIAADSMKFLTTPPLKRGSGQMLNTSRNALTRITFLASLYRMDGDRRFADRACKEMLAIARFSSWNPDHFLDTAEMTAAMAIGYDWLYDVLSPADRDTIRQAIVDKGLKPGIAAYTSGEWWTKVSNNWANVCAGGLALGALAIADEEPDLAQQVLDATRAAMDKPMAAFAPDGGLPEGPAYWAYATRYTVFYIAAAETALGTDLGLCDAGGFDQTGFFRIQTNGPIGKAFNFADSNEFAGPASNMFWLAKHFDQPAFAIDERAFSSKWGDAFHLLWFDGRGTNLADAKVPLDAMFKHTNVACFRGAWNDRGTFYLAMKGGNNAANHAHLDLGSFVLDAFGERWAMDLGSDNYDLPQYFGALRWTYYRARTEGHNTLLIDDQNQDAQATAKIIAFSSAPARALAVVDLSNAYKASVTRARRGIELLNRNAVVIEDEVEANQPMKVQWDLHTEALVLIKDDRRNAALSKGDKTLFARILSPADATFQLGNVNGGGKQNPNKGISKLVVALPERVNSTRIVVLLTGKETLDSVTDVPPLDEWVETGAIAN